MATATQPFIPVDLNQVMEQIIMVSLQEQLQRTNGQIQVNDLPVIPGDMVQITQLFQNLVSNALKFHGSTPPVVKIYARIQPDKPSPPDSNSMVQIYVEDNGIGFEPEYHDRIFGAFERLHSRSEYEGTGIGLAICKKIVERHQGSIKAQSSPEKGSIFILTLPLLAKV